MVRRFYLKKMKNLKKRLATRQSTISKMLDCEKLLDHYFWKNYCMYCTIHTQITGHGRSLFTWTEHALVTDQVLTNVSGIVWYSKLRQTNPYFCEKYLNATHSNVNAKNRDHSNYPSRNKYLRGITWWCHTNQAPFEQSKPEPLYCQPDGDAENTWHVNYSFIFACQVEGILMTFCQGST